MAHVYPCYAIQVRTRYECLTAELLRQKGYDPFVPTYRVRQKWSDRYVTADVPLLPGYILSRFDVAHRLPILQTDGVYGIVGAGRQPIPVDEQELEGLVRVVESRLEASSCAFRQGELVRISKGPLAGIEGTIMEDRGRTTLVVSIELLRRSVSVVIDKDWLSPPAPSPWRADGVAGGGNGAAGLNCRRS